MLCEQTQGKPQPSQLQLPLRPLQSSPSITASDKSSKPQAMQESPLYYIILLPPPLTHPNAEEVSTPSVPHKDSFANLQDTVKQAIFISSILHIMMMQPKDHSLQSQAHLISWLSCTYSQVSLVSSFTKDPPSLHVQTSVHPLFLP